MTKIKISEKLRNLAKIFYPHHLYVTGGYVRNSILCCKLSDIDICSKLKAEEAAQLIQNTNYKITAAYNRLGTLKINCGDENYEYTAFRKDIYDKGGAHIPVKVEFNAELKEDAMRRDFTVNAIYYDITTDSFADPLNGIQDLKTKTIKAYNPQNIFSFDGLRLLRMVRFACELNFEIEKNTYNAAKENFNLLKDIKSERIFDELNKIITSDTKYIKINNNFPHYRGVILLKELGLLPIIFPSIEKSYNVPQRKDFHKYDVFEHIAQTVKYSDKSIRLAALLHDIGKGVCYHQNGNFYGHEKTGAEITAKLLGKEGLKCPNSKIAETVFLVKNHMYDLNCKTSTDKVKLFITANYVYIDKLLLLKQADFLGCGLLSGIAPTVEKWKTIIKQMKSDNAPFCLKDLNIKGNEVKEQGAFDSQISFVLKQLFKDCVLNPKLNQTDILKQKAKRYINNLSKN